MKSIEDLKKEAEKATLRGKPITFNDGQVYVIPTRLLRGEDPKLKELREKAEIEGGIPEESLVEFVDLAVRLNHPEAKQEDINADVECMKEVLYQYVGMNLKN